MDALISLSAVERAARASAAPLGSAGATGRSREAAQEEAAATKAARRKAAQKKAAAEGPWSSPAARTRVATERQARRRTELQKWTAWATGGHQEQPSQRTRPQNRVPVESSPRVSCPPSPWPPARAEVARLTPRASSAQRPSRNLATAEQSGPFAQCPRQPLMPPAWASAPAVTEPQPALPAAPAAQAGEPEAKHLQIVIQRGSSPGIHDHDRAAIVHRRTRRLG